MLGVGSFCKAEDGIEVPLVAMRLCFLHSTGLWRCLAVAFRAYQYASTMQNNVDPLTYNVLHKSEHENNSQLIEHVTLSTSQ